MTNLEVLKDLDERQLLKPLVMGGLISPKVMTHVQIYYEVDAQIKRGRKRSYAVCQAAAIFNVTPRCVNKVLQGLK